MRCLCLTDVWTTAAPYRQSPIMMWKVLCPLQISVRIIPSCTVFSTVLIFMSVICFLKEAWRGNQFRPAAGKKPSLLVHERLPSLSRSQRYLLTNWLCRRTTSILAQNIFHSPWNVLSANWDPAKRRLTAHTTGEGVGQRRHREVKVFPPPTLVGKIFFD